MINIHCQRFTFDDMPTSETGGNSAFFKAELSFIYFNFTMFWQGRDGPTATVFFKLTNHSAFIHILQVSIL